MRVLIVDDDQNFTETIRTIVAAEGHDVVGRADNGRAGVDLAFALQPDVVLMDLEMPVMDGISATRETASQLRTTRVVAISGSDVTAHILDVHAAGAIAHVRKDRLSEELPLVLRSLERERQG